MNDMVGRLDDLLPETEVPNIPEERYWHMIGVYRQVDPLLNQLYMQYNEAKSRLGTLLAGADPHDPMTEVAWDMHDSLRSAIDTRLIELENAPDIQSKVEALQEGMRDKSRKEQKSRKAEREASSFHNIVNFLIWTQLVFRDNRLRENLAQDFAQAS